MFGRLIAHRKRNFAVNNGWKIKWRLWLIKFFLTDINMRYQDQRNMRYEDLLKVRLDMAKKGKP